MLRQRKAAQRFSPLLLDEGEEYEGDWVAVLSTPREYQKQTRASSSETTMEALEAELKGRLRICSMSVVFDPTDLRSPVLKFPLRDASSLIPESSGQGKFTLTTTSFTAMKQNNLDVPYKCVRHPKNGSDWTFTLVYANLEQVIPRLHEALYLSQQGRHDLVRLLRERLEDKLKGKDNTFDTAMYLRDAINEKILTSVPCVLRAPLVHSPGVLVVTTECVYFQQLNDIEGNSPCKIHQVRDVVACCKKKSALREQIALELLFWKPRNPGAPRWDTASAFFAFRSRRECHEAWRTLVTHADVGRDTPIGHDGARLACKLFADSSARPKARPDTLALLEKVTSCWQRGSVSNFHYLVVLNLLSGRTFNDLSQWPVMPWVLGDYTSTDLDLSRKEAFRDLSKPVGALNGDRLALLRERFAMMPDDDPENPPFLYGTHYSNPGYVMYWLVRAAPGHLLRLQSGRFDAPDRMFHSMQESWSSVLSNQADVKELIPEFFVKGLAVKFLRANESLPLGSRQNGKPIDEVELPPWANGPADFAEKHRRALDESSYANANLNEWIDLIFGCKQRGEGAAGADNVFHVTTYYTSKDLAKIDDEVRRDAIEQQAQEFGQTPGQLFSSAHPRRNAVAGAAGGAGAGSPDGEREEEEWLGSTCVCRVVEALMAEGGGKWDLDLSGYAYVEEEEEARAAREQRWKQAQDRQRREQDRLRREKKEAAPSGEEPKLIASLSNRLMSFGSGFNFRKG